MIPLCHPLALAKVTLDITPDAKLPGCIVRATVKVTGPTGVEMEALTAVSVACLTIYDMIKAAERGVRIEGIHLIAKTGGKSATTSRARAENRLASAGSRTSGFPMPDLASPSDSISGLSEREAAERLASEGYNELQSPDRRTLLGIVLEVVREPMLGCCSAAALSTWRSAISRKRSSC